MGFSSYFRRRRTPARAFGKRCQRDGCKEGIRGPFDLFCSSTRHSFLQLGVGPTAAKVVFVIAALGLTIVAPILTTSDIDLAIWQLTIARTSPVPFTVAALITGVVVISFGLRRFDVVLLTLGIWVPATTLICLAHVDVLDPSISHGVASALPVLLAIAFLTALADDLAGGEVAPSPLTQCIAGAVALGLVFVGLTLIQHGNPIAFGDLVHVPDRPPRGSEQYDSSLALWIERLRWGSYAGAVLCLAMGLVVGAIGGFKRGMSVVGPPRTYRRPTPFRRVQIAVPSRISAQTGFARTADNLAQAVVAIVQFLLDLVVRIASVARFVIVRSAQLVIARLDWAGRLVAAATLAALGRLGLAALACIRVLARLCTSSLLGAALVLLAALATVEGADSFAIYLNDGALSSGVRGLVLGGGAVVALSIAWVPLTRWPVGDALRSLERNIEKIGPVALLVMVSASGMNALLGAASIGAVEIGALTFSGVALIGLAMLWVLASAERT